MSLRSVAALVVACFLCVTPLWADETPVRYDGQLMIRTYLTSSADLALLHANGALLVSDEEGIGPVSYVVQPAVLQALDAAGVRYDVILVDVQSAIDKERRAIDEAAPAGPRDTAWFQQYKSFADIVAKLNALVAARPDLCSLTDFGNSLENRDLWALRISGSATPKPGIMFFCTQHAREWISPMVGMWIADQLVSGYDTNPDLHALLDRVEFYIVPVSNPDGYVYTWTTNRLWRKNRRFNTGYNCYGVDINRNWDASFGTAGASSYPCDETYHGPSPFSEPETAALSNFIIAHPQIVTFIDYHSYSQLILSPWGYTSDVPPDNSTFLQVMGEMHDEIYAVHGMQYDFGPIYSTIYEVSGGSVDWGYDARGIFALSIELRDTGTYGFELPANQIIPTCEENFPAAMFLSNWAANPISFSFPNGQPALLMPGTPTPLVVTLHVLAADVDAASPRLYTRLAGGSTFTEHTLTALGNDQFQATLPATACGQTLEYYLSAATTLGTVCYAPTNAPTAVYSVAAQPTVLVLNTNMDTNPGWTTTGQWAWGHPTGGGGEHGGPDPNNGFTGANVYGYNLAGDYADSIPEYHLTTSAINCSGLTGVHLSFYRWLGVEQPQYDHAYLRVSNNGTTWNTIWQNTAQIADLSWVHQEFDISAYANNQPNVRLRWTMGQADGAWRYCGWNIDDVQVTALDPAGCAPLPGDMNCDGIVDFGDINPFVTALLDATLYGQQYPDCDIALGDLNDSGTVGFDDINPFVTLLVGP